MGIQAVGFDDLSMDPVHLSGSGGDPQLKTLEQKLQKLHQEKKKAVQNHDEQKVKELEKQIEQVKQKIDQLKNNRRKEDDKEDTKGPGYPSRSPLDGSVGRYIDRFA